MERATRRAGGSYLLKADVSQFYPSLYTHAVGWAIDPKLRERKHWQNNKLLGKKIDKALMDIEGKVSQGIPTGNDISFLLSECVLAQVDAALGVRADRAYRWFDDYEISFDTREEAESCMKLLSRELAKFQLRLNPTKTKILQLPQASEEEWQSKLVETGGREKINAHGLVKHFDTAFRLRDVYSESPVLLYAMGVLFGIGCPNPQVGRVAQSCLTQALLFEPGSAQKAFALLTYWLLNGFVIDVKLLTETINQLVVKHEASGVSSDISWALSFCLEQGIVLGAKAAKVLSRVDDDCIALQALHMWSTGLLPSGFTTNHISGLLKNADLDRGHWLLAYETVRQGFVNDSELLVRQNPLFADFLAKGVSFYRTHLPSYASVVHPGGAPEWVIRQWIDSRLRPEREPLERQPGAPIPQSIANDLARLGPETEGSDDAVFSLLELAAGPLMAGLDDLNYPV